MAFVHGVQSRLYMNDKHISGVISGYSASFDANLAETTTLLAGGTQSIPGLVDGSLSLDGNFEEESVQDLRTASQADNGVLMTAAPAGLTAGSPAFILRGDASGFEVESSVDDKVSMSYEAQSDNGVDWGRVLADGSAKTATGNGTDVTETADSSNGGVASLHVSDASASDTLDVTIEHSDDGALWTTLATFTQVTAAGSQFITIPRGTAVESHVRARHVIAGTSPSFSFLVAFARR